MDLPTDKQKVNSLNIVLVVFPDLFVQDINPDTEPMSNNINILISMYKRVWDGFGGGATG
ncbi:hypothetical protein C4579_02020 [Candidatus Microgenomates bacterium]|nr:MAG: hypothetical protein C4579_02020 [Candidatus Microgenomates bacterium]